MIFFSSENTPVQDLTIIEELLGIHLSINNEMSFVPALLLLGALFIYSFYLAYKHQKIINKSK